jgi:hypothetical protein
MMWLSNFSWVSDFMDLSKTFLHLLFKGTKTRFQLKFFMLLLVFIVHTKSQYVQLQERYRAQILFHVDKHQIAYLPCVCFIGDIIF